MYLSRKQGKEQAVQAMQTPLSKLQSGQYIGDAQDDAERDFLLFVKALTTENPKDRPTASQALMMAKNI